MMSSLYSVSEKVILKTNYVEQIIPHEVGYLTTVVNRQSQPYINCCNIFKLIREPCLEENIIKH